MAEYTDLQDWELLQSPDTLSPLASVASDCGIDFDYFALDSDKKGTECGDGEEGYVASDESSDAKKSVVGNGIEMGTEEIESLQEDLSHSRRVGGESTRIEVRPGEGDVMSEKFGANSDVFQVFTVDCVECLQEKEKITETEDKSSVAGSGHYKEVNFSERCSSDTVRGRELSGENNHEKSESENLPVETNNKLSIALWKMPLEFAKYCVFKVKPFWSFSAAVALIGFVVLGRRLYRLKRRTQILPLRMGIDDKKASQSVTRAARLNEAFSTMRRVGLIKPSLPTNGITPWPAMALS